MQQSKNLTSVIQVRLDSNLKQAAEQLFSELGLDTPSAIRLFLKQSLLQGRIPFSIVRHTESLVPESKQYTTEELDMLLENSISKSLVGTLKHPAIPQDINDKAIRAERLENYENPA